MTSPKPINYTLIFEPDLKTFIFKGTANIRAEVKTPINKFSLHSADIKILNCEIISQNETQVPQLNQKDEDLYLVFKKHIQGQFDIRISFEGHLNDQLVGWYRSRYEYNNEEKYLATTQFEAADARRAFPCFDSPDQKATFDISITLDENLDAISNMPVLTEQQNQGKKTVKFQTTPIMSTYLLYLGIGEFEYLIDDQHPIIRVITTKGKKDQGKFALKLGRIFLEYFEDYFGVKYPLPKLDLIAIPDFAAGAMENWGAITFRENALLFDEKFSSSATKQRVAEIIAHEIAHQWFGNLVTMKWWNDLWLNEAFATFMATKAVDSVFPEFDFWSQFLSDSTEEGMRLDSLKSSHPIEAKVKTPKEIAEIFDDISYDKGGSVLRMLENYLGEDTFSKGIKKYLVTHSFSNTDSVDLWQSLQSVSGKPIVEMLTGWIKQTGYPLITCKRNKDKLKLSQTRFLMQGTEATTWMIPISLYLDQKQISVLMRSKKTSVNIGLSPYYKLNPGQIGFYRARYPDEDLNRLLPLIKSKSISNADRWGIQSDLYALFLAGKSEIQKYFNLVKSYYEEDDFLTCSDIQNNLFSLYLLSTEEKFFDIIIKENIEFLERNYQRLGWTPAAGEKHTNAILRSKTLLLLGKMYHDEIFFESKKRFEAYLLSPDQLVPDLQTPVFNTVAWRGDLKLFDTFVKLYKNAKTQEEKIRFLSALSNFEDISILKKTLSIMLTNEVRSSDIIYPLGYLTINPSAKTMIWPWVKDNWSTLNKRLGGTKMLLRRVIANLSVLSDQQSKKEIQTFFNNNPEEGIQMALQQALEKIEINISSLVSLRKELSE